MQFFSLLKKIKVNLSKKTKSIFLDENEKKFLKDNKAIYIPHNINKKYIGIQIAQDYFFLLNMKLVVNKFSKNGYSAVGIVPYNMHVLKKNLNIIELLSTIKSIIMFELRLKKWIKLYNSIGIKIIFKIPYVDFKNDKIKKINASKKNNNINFLNFKINNLVIGDLLYDTYLKFRSEMTLNINDTYVKKLLLISRNIINSISEIYKKKKFEYYFTSFSSYIHHGIPCRYFLDKKVKVYSYGSIHSYAKKLSIKDSLHNDNFVNLKKNFLKLKDKNVKIQIAKRQIVKKFRGKDEISSIYLGTNNPYKKNLRFFNDKKIKGVLFLHDFFDAPHDRGEKHLFADYYLWADFTMNCIVSHNLEIAVKPHPNQVIENVKVINFLKKKYPQIYWIDINVNNLNLINKIDFGISINGSILYELAFFNKIGISASTNPTTSFKVFKDPRTIKEYEYFLLNPEKARIKKKTKIEACKLYYSYFLNNNEDLGTDAHKFNLNKLNRNSSYDFFLKNRELNHFIN